ncbi:MAG: DUF4331 family protein [Candidatus Eremiobacteraeota bacterium]|nr:DUF4331 family protein [Candidatus Eremiobacteraeota bacterium]MBC5827374.1 DUF4331 family protein [Candidatus Eremiobacteraeota bacterium]
MNLTSTRLAGGVAIAALAAAVFLYTSHPVSGSDHQDSPTMLARPGADITDAYIFPSPANSANVVLAMNTHPLIPAGAGTNTFFDPAVLYQFKIDNTGTTHVENQVIQFKANGTGASQTITMYGPAAPSIAGTTSVLLTPTATFKYNTPTTLANGMQVFAGPRKDTFFFDLLTFFQIVPDRFYACHANPVPAQFASLCAGGGSSFNGFTAAYNAAHAASCSTKPAMDFLSANQFNVLSFVVELPRTALAPKSGSPGKIYLWSTTSTTTGS